MSKTAQISSLTLSLALSLTLSLTLSAAAAVDSAPTFVLHWLSPRVRTPRAELAAWHGVGTRRWSRHAEQPDDLLHFVDECTRRARSGDARATRCGPSVAGAGPGALAPNDRPRA